MASGKSSFGQERKFMNHLMLIDYMMKDHVTKKVVECRKLEELYNTLLSYIACSHNMDDEVIYCCEKNLSNPLYQDLMKEWMKKRKI